MLTLTQHIGVRIPARQPRTLHLRLSTYTLIPDYPLKSITCIAFPSMGVCLCLLTVKFFGGIKSGISNHAPQKWDRKVGTTMRYLLSDVAVRTSKPRLKAYKLTDGGGMYLHISPSPSGSKLWRYQYRFQGKKKLMALGVYPDISLAQARERHQTARKLLAGGQDPMAARKAAKALEAEPKMKVDVVTFEAVFQKWFEWWGKGKAPKHAAQVERRVNADIIPIFGKKPIDDVTAADVRDMMLAIAGRGAKDVARRAHETASQIFRYAIARGHASRNPCVDFRPSDIIIKPVVENFARVSTKDLPALLTAMDAYNGTGVTKFAMRLLAVTFVRTSELIEAPWVEFDLDRALWEIPKERMKMGSAHLVPLSRQAVEVLRSLKMLTGTHALVFPGDLDKGKPMSNNTILFALYRLGYKGRMTGHGFRGLASTILHENGFESEHIELQLAHQNRNKVAAAYNHAKYLKQRKAVMQWWADYLDAQLAKGRQSINGIGAGCSAVPAVDPKKMAARIKQPIATRARAPQPTVGFRI